MAEQENDFAPRTYATRDECIEREIIAAIEAHVGVSKDEYDIDGIAFELIDTIIPEPHGEPRYYIGVSPEVFWESVARHELPESSDEAGER